MYQKSKLFRKWVKFSKLFPSKNWRIIGNIHPCKLYSNLICMCNIWENINLKIFLTFSVYEDEIEIEMREN